MNLNKNDHIDSYESFLLKNYIQLRTGALNNHAYDMISEFDIEWEIKVETRLAGIFIAMVFNCEAPKEMRGSKPKADEFTVALIYNKIKDYIESIDCSILADN